ncbi:MAG: UxaA family hydrolase [Firmicutes bacterium]|jgi:(2R)-sulfolactate sulfo-lyase subunit alpha|nr:UxaA family hydrolase [Bacillota bacterium]
MAHGFLIHDDHDHVGVAVRDLQAGDSVTGVYQKSLKETRITLREAVPLGHKVALKNLNQGDQIIEYNAVIGVATQAISVGNHVHVHNIKSVRWA